MSSYESFINPDYNGFQTLEYLNQKFPYHSSDEWTELINQKRVRINQREATVNQILKKGDLLTYEPIVGRILEPKVNENYSILLETVDAVFVNKPPNLPVHPAGRYRTQTLLTFLEKIYPVVFPVHRIDRETSGILIFAKSEKSRQYFQRLFEERKIQKKYLAIVKGKLSDSIQLNGFIGKDVNSEIRKKQVFKLNEAPGFKTSITEFEPILFDEVNNLTLIMVKPTTGRIHQIRASLLYLKLPILGDKMYGERESAFLDFVKMGESAELDAELGHNRQALHAYSLSYMDENGNEIFVKASLSDDLCHFFPEFDRTMSQN